MTHPRPGRRLAAITFAACAAATAQAATPAQLLSGYTAQAGAAPSPARGQQFFTTTHGGREWSCASCHGQMPTGPGRHAGTGKPIAALAPAASGRFTDPAKVEKWFRRNCNDVAARECTPAEKADVLAWLITLKP